MKKLKVDMEKFYKWNSLVAGYISNKRKLLTIHILYTCQNIHGGKFKSKNFFSFEYFISFEGMPLHCDEHIGLLQACKATKIS